MWLVVCRLRSPVAPSPPVAFVVPTEGVFLDERAFVAFLKDKLADYKVPRKVFPMLALPRNATGKVLKNVLTSGAVNPFVEE